MKNRLFAPWVPLGLAVILLASAAGVGVTNGVPTWLPAYQSQTRDLVNTLVSLAGWLLTLAGLLQAGKEAKRGLTFNSLLKLHEDEAELEQAEAKRLVWQAAPPKDYSGNIYIYVRQYIHKLPPKRRERLDLARRRITRFWYKVARLVEIEALTPNDVFRSLGPPDILTILEPLEAIQAENIDPNWRPRSWPPMRLLIYWQEQRGNKGSDLQPEVPAKPELYEASKTN